MSRQPGRVAAAASEAAAHHRSAAPHALAAAGVPRYLQASAAADPQVHGAVATARSGGAPLTAAPRERFEPRLQADFSAVRVHADGAAARAARGVGARAFTIGRDIVFGAGQYAPDSRAGQRLLAHELVHVTQQERSGEAALQRDGPAPAAPLPAGQLASEAEAVRQSLMFDTAVPQGRYAVNFGLKGSLVTPANVDETVDWDCPLIDALADKAVRTDLFTGLRSYAHGVFDLHAQGGEGKHKDDAAGTRLNLVHIANLDLSPWSGPNAAFRFSAVGSNKKGKITVHIRVEEMPLQTPLAAAADAPAIDKAKAAPHGLTHDATVDAALWTRVLQGLDKISETMIAHVGAVRFTMSTAARGPHNEAAEFGDSRPKGATAWTRSITLYQDMVGAGDAEFAFTLAHEIGHGASYAPTQGDKGRQKGALHDAPGFLAAAKKDGGRAKAVTSYGRSDAAEFYAECYAMFVQQPQTLALLRPNTYAWFVQFDEPATASP